MKKKSSCLNLAVAVAMSALPSAWAGSETGNGGDAVVCRNAQGRIMRAQLLDYYEATTQYGFTPVFSQASSDPAEKAVDILSRFENALPEQSRLAQDYARHFMEETSFLPNVTLTDIPDSGHVAIPDGCRVEQAAIQQNPRYSEQRRYVISTSIWNALNVEQKAGLIVHEVLYRIVLTNGATNSIDARYLTGWLSADRIATTAIQETLTKFRQAHLVGETVNVNGNQFLSDSVQPSESDPTKVGRAAVAQEGLRISSGANVTNLSISRGAIIPLNHNWEVDLSRPIKFSAGSPSPSGAPNLYSLSTPITSFHIDSVNGFAANEEVFLTPLGRLDVGRFEYFHDSSGQFILPNRDGRTSKVCRYTRPWVTQSSASYQFTAECSFLRTESYLNFNYVSRITALEIEISKDRDRMMRIILNRGAWGNRDINFNPDDVHELLTEGRNNHNPFTLTPDLVPVSTRPDVVATWERVLIELQALTR